MCGVVGYIGDKKTGRILINGLKKLEYRGYDSAGVCMLVENELSVIKEKGRVDNLEKRVFDKNLKSDIGIGHTRWATHGEPNSINSHPHISQNKEIAVVHNGIIENYYTIKEKLLKNGYNFISETDTEVIPNLIEYYYNGNYFDAVKKAVNELQGSFALGIIIKNEPDKLIAVRYKSPLIVGLGDNENFIASDISALTDKTEKICYLEDREIAVLEKNKVSFYNFSGEPVNKSVHNSKIFENATQKDGFEHYMLKEIHEQPKAVKNTLKGRITKEKDVIFAGFNERIFKEINKIYIVACGSAYHAGLVGKNFIERLAKIPVMIEIASEFRYQEPVVDKHTLVIAISQSGETADTIAGVEAAKKKGAFVMSVTNVLGSSVARMSDYVFYTNAGPEISVASTKAYMTQVVSMYLFGIYYSYKIGKIDRECQKELVDELIRICEELENVLRCEKKIERISDRILDEKNIYFIGRGFDYAVSLEASLKLKEISYINCVAYPAGELKHGPIALIDTKTIVVAINTDRRIADKTYSNIKEAKARGAYVIAVVNKYTKDITPDCDEYIELDCDNSIFSPICTVVPMQMLAYFTAKKKGYDVDKPRNLAKSVTVE